MPGSFFNITGSGYPSNRLALIHVNGVQIGSALTGMDDSFSLTLSTPPIGSAGLYIVVVDSWAKKCPQKGSLAIMAVSLRAER